MLSRLLDAGLSDPPALRWALLGGGSIPAPLLERAASAGVPVAPTYGMTEACSQIVTAGLEPDIVRRVVAMVDRAEYKRRQAPPGVKITPRAFGRDRRLPVASERAF